MLFRKTPTNERGIYRFHSATGETFVITPEEVGEENIRLLHAADDAIVYNNIKNSRPQIQEWQKPGIEQWKAQHRGEEVPKNWNLSMDGLTQTEDADHSSYMKELAEKTMDAGEDPMKELLYEMLMELPKESQQLYQLYYIDELSQQDIADVFGVSQNTISKRIRKLESMLTEMCRKNI
jgi:RNA polymerase sigma factor (sigma-70 family)